MTPLRFLADGAADSTNRADAIFWVLIALSGAVILALLFLVSVYCIRYRSGSNAIRPRSLNVHRVEIAWLAATLIAFLAIAGWSNVSFVESRTPPTDAYTVYVVGKRWMWKVEHPTGRREIDQLHVPVGEPVRLILASDDVIHSFYIPAYRLKQDAVPGRYTSLWFTPLHPGRFHLFCAEYCGAEHSGMIGSVIALPRDEFDRWAASTPLEAKTPGMPGTAQAPLVLGGSIFGRLGCAACHVRNSAVLAPRLDGLWGRPTRLTGGKQRIVDENYIRESILDPQAEVVAGYASPSLMPSYRGQVTESDLIHLIEYIRSIRDGWPDEAGTTLPVQGPDRSELP